MNLKAWLKSNKAIFRDSDLRFIIKTVKPNPKAVLGFDQALSKEELADLDKIKRLYIKGMPLAYILGKEEFFGLEFIIDQRVLAPRPETELIVEKAIELIKQYKLFSVLDLCTGSGNIGLSIKKSIDKKVNIFASDIDAEAIQVAGLNKIFHNSDIKLVRSNLLEGFKLNSFDLIVANPPYVESDKIRGALNFEPRLALEGGKDGLLIIRKILKQADKYLKNEGYLILEIGYNSKKGLEDLIFKLKPYQIKEWIKDYSGFWRGVVLKK